MSSAASATILLELFSHQLPQLKLAHINVLVMPILVDTILPTALCARAILRLVSMVLLLVLSNMLPMYDLVYLFHVVTIM